MENTELKIEDLRIEALGETKIPSPLGLGKSGGDDSSDYVEDTRTVLIDSDRDHLVARVRDGKDIPAFQLAGPRHRIFFEPGRRPSSSSFARTIFFEPGTVKAAIVTCGGLCPGINNVIRTLVFELHYRYSVRSIMGIRYGYRGFIPKYGYEPVALTPDFVKDIHEKGGSILSSSRGGQDPGEMVDFLQRNRISLLFTIGGDGTLRGALDIQREAKKRGLAISVIGIPKTVDNDIAFVERTFGLETAFSVAAESIRSAHTEAIGAPNGIGIVKVMGRMSGYIAANAALALAEVNFCLIPEVPFGMSGSFGLYALIEAAIGRHRGAVFDVFTRTCGHTFSQLPIVHLPCSGHYLCTVAACGHPKLVRPLRLGQRGGQPIVVNRQLAMANAFEDLLHERFPRFGCAARRAYDRVGLPISRWVRHRLLADVIYVLMKPAEWAFYVFLLLFDPCDPEVRLARMYPWK